MIDIHSHILPGMDDGPRTMSESLRMCEAYVAEEVRVVVATPHMGDPLFPSTPAAVRRAASELTAECLRRGLPLSVLPGADTRLTPELLADFDAGRLLTAADRGRHLLIELPPQTVPHIEGLIFQLHLRGVTPVISHPERNLELQQKPWRLGELVEAGCLAQITAGALLGHFGRPDRRAAETFLDRGLVHFVASDAHAARGPRGVALAAARLRLKTLVAEAEARLILVDYPNQVVAGADTPDGDRTGTGPSRQPAAGMEVP